jgi:hypothetical protein
LRYLGQRKVRNEQTDRRDRRVANGSREKKKSIDKKRKNLENVDQEKESDGDMLSHALGLERDGVGVLMSIEIPS